MSSQHKTTSKNTLNVILAFTEFVQTEYYVYAKKDLFRNMQYLKLKIPPPPQYI